MEDIDVRLVNREDAIIEFAALTVVNKAIEPVRQGTESIVVATIH